MPAIAAVGGFLASSAGAATISAAGAIGGALLANKGASQAANAQTQAANSANATQLQIFNQQRSDAEPWRQTGMQALNLMGSLYGFKPTWAPQREPQGATQAAPGGDLGAQLQAAGIQLGSKQARLLNAYREAQATNPQYSAEPVPADGAAPVNALATPANASAWLTNMPGYKFRMDEGTKAANTSWAASGMRESGAAQKALLRYGQDYASGEFNNEWNRLAGLAGVGQAVNNSNNQLAQNYANQTGQNTMNAGAARASSYAQQGNNWANAFGYAAGRVSNIPWGSSGSSGDRSGNGLGLGW